MWVASYIKYVIEIPIYDWNCKPCNKHFALLAATTLLSHTYMPDLYGLIYVGRFLSEFFEKYF